MPTVISPKKAIIPTYPLIQFNGTKPSMIEVRESKGQDISLDPGFLESHRKDFYLFVLVEDGNSRHWVDFMPYTTKPGHFYFSNPQQTILKEEIKPTKGFVVCFTEEFLMLEENRMLRQLPVIQNPEGGHEIILSAGDNAYLQDVMRKMAAEFKTDQSWHNQMLTSWLRVLVIYLSRLYSEQFGGEKITQNHCLLKSFQQLLGEQYADTHDVAAYAAQLNITPGHLNEVIKQQSGKTAISNIHNRLIVEAKRRLLHTELSVKQIADELGFEDAAYFNRFFKRLVNCTPAAYRQQIREMYS